MATATIHFSKMTGKLDGLRAISTNTATNEYCIKQNACGNDNNICTKCYSHAMLKTYRKNMAPALQRNSDYLSADVYNVNDLPFITDAFIRINAHGELINTNHFVNIVHLAEVNPHCNIVLWTKRNDIVQKVLADKAKPSNLILIYSNPKIGTVLKRPPQFFDKTFNNVLKDEYVERQNCTGQQCKSCMLCYKHNDVDTIVEAVKKY